MIAADKLKRAILIWSHSQETQQVNEKEADILLLEIFLTYKNNNVFDQNVVNIYINM